MPSVTFAAETFVVFENESNVNIIISRSGDMSLNGSFRLKTYSASALRKFT